MKLNAKTFFVYLSIFAAAFISIGLSVVTRIGLLGLPQAFSNLMVFLLIAIITFFALHFSKGIMSGKQVYSVMIAAWLVLFIPKAISSSSDFVLLTLPFFVSFIAAIVGGSLYYIRRSFKFLVLLGMVPLIFAFGFDTTWHDMIVYESVNSSLQKTKAPEFSFLDKHGNEINNESIRDKITILDFWFISCPPCWVKFPELQRIYDQYGSDDRVAIYAVNRPMKKDKPNQLFTAVEKKGYTFPVAKGSTELMKEFQIEYYPTVLVIDTEGNIIFKGGIEKVEEEVQQLLNQNL